MDPTVTPTTPATLPIRPITRAYACQLNCQVLSFLSNVSNVHENMMLPNLDTAGAGFPGHKIPTNEPCAITSPKITIAGGHFLDIEFQAVTRI